MRRPRRTLFLWSGVVAGLERPRLKVGFIPIIDCAPIVLAEELGAFERQGLEVEIHREVSWANVRDKLALGVLDASHILAPLPLAQTLGIDSVSVPMINAMTLEVNGNALTLSKSLWQEMEEAAPQFVGAQLANKRAPLDARVDVYCVQDELARFGALGNELRFLLITSEAQVHAASAPPAGAVPASNTGRSGVWILARPTDDPKCVRCWQRRPDVGADRALRLGAELIRAAAPSGSAAIASMPY